VKIPEKSDQNQLRPGGAPDLAPGHATLHSRAGEHSSRAGCGRQEEIISGAKRKYHGREKEQEELLAPRWRKSETGTWGTTAKMKLVLRTQLLATECPWQKKSSGGIHRVKNRSNEPRHRNRLRERVNETSKWKIPCAMVSRTVRK
jgi:hypothetical protein